MLVSKGIGSLQFSLSKFPVQKRKHAEASFFLIQDLFITVSMILLFCAVLKNKDVYGAYP
jgi:hypothetical protein